MGSDYSLPILAQMPLTQLKQVKEQRDFQPAVCAYAEGQLWKVHYTRKSAAANAAGVWVSQVYSKGYPDLHMVRLRPDGTAEQIFAELKAEGGRVEPEQEEWLARLSRLPATRCYVWKPRDAAAIMESLS
jgi:hypothetical protein